ncbi:hypothetical protein [Yeosuana aromativorans]|uniref:hypothetical protein n=1 Tax=Yeosuana aromativorans TaxID=288019 RepID=UPI001E426588|nr:hypothetical protein [Yeosuana aromativorans]
MKKIVLIIITVFLNIALHSCTPQGISVNIPVATDDGNCCGDGGDIPPPHPPTTGG